MASVLKEILDSFYAELEESDALDGKAIEALRNLFDSGKNLKADDFVEILSAEAQEAEP